MVGRQNADAADTLHLRDVVTATVLAFCIWGHIHGRKSRGDGGTLPPEFVLRGTAMMFVPPEFTTYNVLNNAVCHLFILICTRYNVLHCI